jgi:hypothetical protein
MKSSQITLIVIGFILLALMATNPSIEDHRQAVMEKMKEKMAESSNSESKNDWQKAGEAIGMSLGQGIVEKAVSRGNFLLFSLTKISFRENVKQIGIGAFGKVWLNDNFNNNEIEETYPQKYDPEIIAKEAAARKEAQNRETLAFFNRYNMTGNYLSIGNLEVAEHDFPQQIDMELAITACSRLGIGWRLPTLNELKLMCEKKTYFGGFSDKIYISSTKSGNTTQSISFSSCLTSDNNFGKVRAVRSKN